MLTACNKATTQKEYFNDGTLKSEKTYEEVKGEQTLVHEVSYHSTGEKYMEGSYVNGMREGKWTSWHKDGRLWSEGEFKQDKSHGERKVYYPNGNLHYKGSFDLGKRVGNWIFYDEDGIKINEINYDSIPATGIK
ncbi:MAG: hypothetical protein PHX54_07740 [Lentimicrobiaceae bacterium]|nr:hypothetical protein [Lentimicrobiaceae bacterium]